MDSIQSAAQPSVDELLRGASQLSVRELNDFVEQILDLRARRVAPLLPKSESDLLARINEGLSAQRWARYEQLKDRRSAGTLTPAEHAELVRVGDELEDIQARRLEALAELARLRGVTVPALMAKLGIRPGKHA